MTAVEHLVHLFPVGAALLADHLKQRWNREHVVFDHLAVIPYEMQHLGLCATGAVHHAMNLGAHLVEQHLNDRSIGAGGGEHQLSGSHRNILQLVIQPVSATIYQFVGYGMVITLGIFLCQVFCKHIMTGGGESVATHTTVVLLLVGSLSEGSQSYDAVARTDIGIIDYITAFHTTGDGGVNDDRAYQITHISCLTPRGIDADAHITHLLEQFVGAVDDG